MTRSCDHEQKKKGTCRIVNLLVSADHRVKLKESEKRDKYLDLAREFKKSIEHEGDDESNCSRCARYNQ